MKIIQKIIIVVFTVLFIQSCKNVGLSKGWKNENIDTENKQQIKTLNDKLFKAIGNKDELSLRMIMSDSLIQKAGDIGKLLNQISTYYKADSYRIIDEYYTNNSTIGIGNNAISGISGDNDYVVRYLAQNEEMYVSLILPNGFDNESLMLAIYGKYKNEWKLNILQFGQYSLFKKNAPEYYKIAKSSYDKSHLIDAYLNAYLAYNILKPVNEHFQYQKEKEITEFYEKVRTELNSKYLLPLTLKNINTQPKIFNIYPEMTDSGFCPMIQYLTEIDLNNALPLKNENELVKKEIRQIFFGIEQDKKYIFYQAFNELPDGEKLLQHFGFVEQLKK